MDLFSVFTLLGGLAFFLYGMTIMSNGLEKMTGGKLERAIRKMTSSPIKSLALGTGITIAIQSSSAVTVMLVGFVNSGIMALENTIGIIMGSNIGTTSTAWILSLSSIKGESFLARLLKPEAFSPIIAVIGTLLIMCSKSSKKRDIGNIIIGFSLLMYGMKLMSDAVSPLADIPEFAHLLVAFTNPFLGVLAGTLFTGVIQSSSASVGILQALSLTGGITYEMAIPIIMGQNIGTCVTALISSIGVNKNAKRVAIVHIYFNLIGTAVCLGVFLIMKYGINCPFISQTTSPVGIAVAHSIFNIATTMLLLPFHKKLVQLAKWTIKDMNEEEQYSFLDERLLFTPSVAIAECKECTIKMAQLVKENLYSSLETLEHYNSDIVLEIQYKEKLIDQHEDKIGTYLVKLSSRELSDLDSKDISKMLHMIGDFERIGDHAINITDFATECVERKIQFSNEAKLEMKKLTEAVKEIMEMAVNAFINDDIDLAKRVEPLEEVIDYLKIELKKRHVDRLKLGKCTIEQGLVFNDFIANCERISDHCSNVAVCIIQVKESSFETHQYLEDIKSELTGPFIEEYKHFKCKYQI
ncbi:MAG: Na/Pi cotransporter family protein [Cellulosilyticum sp.]|nr:Na/Pi cotransporter family protein [Cellulosilyticum sp.]